MCNKRELINDVSMITPRPGVCREEIRVVAVFYVSSIKKKENKLDVKRSVIYQV